jgi:phage tail sheath gpL-like
VGLFLTKSPTFFVKHKGTSIMATIRLSVTTGRPASTLQSTYQTVGDSRGIVNKLAAFLTSVSSGSESTPSIIIRVQENEGRASGTLTLASVVATNSCVINGVTFTAVASGATGNQFNVGVDDPTTAANLAAAINASITAFVSGYVVATSSGAVVTVLSVFYALAGNMITLAGGTNITASGSKLTGGTLDPNTQTLSF